MGNLKEGDRVQLIDELTEGVVLEIGKDRLRIRTGDGFELEVAPGEVIRLPGAGSLPLEVPGFPSAETTR